MGDGFLVNYYNDLLLFTAPAFVGGFERGFPCFDSSCRTLRLVGRMMGVSISQRLIPRTGGVSRVPKKTVVLCAILIV